MRGELIKILSLIEEKANELTLDGYEPDVVLFGFEAYEFLKNQVNKEFGGEEEVLELSGMKVRLLESSERTRSSLTAKLWASAWGERSALRFSSEAVALENEQAQGDGHYIGQTSRIP